MSELAWLILLEVTYQQGHLDRPWPWSRALHYMLKTQPIRKEPARIVDLSGA